MLYSNKQEPDLIRIERLEQMVMVEQPRIKEPRQKHSTRRLSWKNKNDYYYYIRLSGRCCCIRLLLIDTVCNPGANNNKFEYLQSP